tara:strand:- start:253 stop:1464 length:1212 start_codon:yes stop_codon:yes gene_type:complete
MNLLKYFLLKSIYILKAIIINFLLLYFLLFILEIYFQIKNDNFLSESKYYYREKLKNNQIISHLAYMPYKLILKKDGLIPLSGISNTRTIFCRENKNSKFHEYFSDEFGFNNNNNLKEFDILMIGDSYVHGLCLDRESTLISHIENNNFTIKNHGMSANGPLLEYATFKEYSELYKFEYVVWVFNPDNDFYDFSNEVKNSTLLEYLNDEDYKQDLINKNEEKDSVIINYFNYNERQTKELIKHYHLDLKYIRKNISNFYYQYKNTSEHDLSLENENSYDIINNKIKLIEKIFLSIKENLDNKNINFLVVINAIDPFYQYAKKEHLINEYEIIKDQTKMIKEFLDDNSINYIDFEKHVRINYSYNNIDKIFKRVNNENKEFDHYTSEGNKILADMIVKKLKRSQ